MRQTPNHKRRPAGFTLVELMVGVAIIGVLSAFAVPAFDNFMVNERVKNAAIDVTSSLVVARSEAIKQNGTVTVTPTSASTAWAAGWLVKAPDTTTIATQAAFPSSITITGPTSISFNRSGRAASAVTVVVAPATASTVSSRCISISLTGLPKSVLGSTC